jgi:hypothetical protein
VSQPPRRIAKLHDSKTAVTTVHAQERHTLQSEFCINSSRQGKTLHPVILQIGAEPPQTLIADPDAPDADSYKNKDYEFYALKSFITLTHKSHGTVVKFYNACRVE